jgi:hypothetical protein
MQPRRLPTTILQGWSLSKRFIPLQYCVRYASRWNPNNPEPKKPVKIPRAVEPEDPKIYIEGWKEFKETLARRATTNTELDAIDELSPDEAQHLMNSEDDSEDMNLRTSGTMASRHVPDNRNYFSGQPLMEQQVQNVEKIYEKYNHLPKAPSHIWPIRQWKTSGAGGGIEGEDSSGSSDNRALKGKHSRAMVTMAKELNKIHPVIMPKELKDWLNNFAPLRITGGGGTRQRRVLDKYERSRGNGKRKTARAKVHVLPGEGLVYVNGKPAAEHFTRIKDVENVIWPLQSLGVLRQYNVWVSTWGGGTTGAISRK